MDPAQYRPICVPSNLLRLLTVRMCKLMSKIVEEHELLGPEQFGFRKHRSTLDAIFVLSTMLRKARSQGYSYAASFIDINKVTE